MIKYEVLIKRSLDEDPIVGVLNSKTYIGHNSHKKLKGHFVVMEIDGSFSLHESKHNYTDVYGYIDEILNVIESPYMCEEKGDNKKFDHGKLRWDLMPFDSLNEICEVITYGANKYEENGWKKVKAFRYIGALLRHISAHKIGEERDKESGLRHLAHAGANVLFLLHLIKPNKTIDK